MNKRALGRSYYQNSVEITLTLSVLFLLLPSVSAAGSWFVLDLDWTLAVFCCISSRCSLKSNKSGLLLSVSLSLKFGTGLFRQSKTILLVRMLQKSTPKRKDEFRPISEKGSMALTLTKLDILL